MTEIILTTEISAPIARCFDVSRNIDLHQRSMSHTNERAIGGRTSGLCELNDEITWEATHFWIKQTLTSKITQFNYPIFFEDTMLRGAFKSMRHEHHFEEKNGTTITKDIFRYEVPYNIFGILFNGMVLKEYMKKILIKRNNFLKLEAEKIYEID